jgi:ABC-2 type transport system permease protein
MNRLVRTELLKQRTTRVPVAGICAAPVVAGLITFAILDLSGKDGNDPLGPKSLVQVIGGPAGVITVIAVLLGVLGMAGEYRHQTITTTFLASPRRRDVVAAKLAAHALTGALMGLLSLAVSSAIAVPWLLSSGIDINFDDDTAWVAAGLIVSTALYGALGVSIGAIVRNQTTAAAVVLIWLLAIEGFIGDLLHDESFVEWLPAAVGRALVHVGPNADGLGTPAAAAVFALYVAGFAFAGIHLTLDRDIS